MDKAEAIERLEYLKARAQIALEQEVPDWIAEDLLGTIEAYDMAIEALQTEPSNSEIPNNCEDEPQYEMGMGTLRCDNCSEYGSFKCTKCDGEMYFKRLEPKDEPQKDCNGCRFVGTYDTEFPCANCSRKTKDYYAKDEQTDCPWK